MEPNLDVDGRDVDIRLLKPLHERNINLKSHIGFRKIVASMKVVGLLEPVKAEIARRVSTQIGDAERDRRRAKAVAAREHAHACEVSRIAQHIRAMFPGMPPEEADGIACHGWAVGSGRVGRASGLDEEYQIVCAVKAHIRHCHTDYDELLQSPSDRDYARDEVRADIHQVFAKWKRQPQSDIEPEADCGEPFDTAESHSRETTVSHSAERVTA